METGSSGRLFRDVVQHAISLAPHASRAVGQGLCLAGLAAVRESKKKAIREDLMRVINAELKNGQVTAIHFTEIVTQ